MQTQPTAGASIHAPDLTAAGLVEIRDRQRFAFGANWRSFVARVDEESIAAASDSLAEALGRRNLAGRTFLDIGCGSGLFSLAAHQLGALVRSFDLDGSSVVAATELRRRFAPQADWLIEQGSILDPRFVGRLGCFDVVYAWGVLHHTGDVWRAMAAAARLVAPGGQLYLSVYNDQGAPSRAWRRVKRRYNASGPVTRAVLIAASAAYLGRRRPFRALHRLCRVPAGGRSRLPRARGMSAKHDLIDWVGGYPFEVARPERVFDHVRGLGLGYELRRLRTSGGGIGCNEFVFERSRSAAAAAGGQLACP